MKNKAIWLGLSFLIVAAMLLASCATSTTTSATTSTLASPPTSTPTYTPTTTVTSTRTTATTTTTTTGNWWDSFGKPQYGGEMVLRVNKDIVLFDPAFPMSQETIMSGWMEPIFADDWTLDPSVFSYIISFRPYQYIKGNLAESWEFTDPSTYVIHLRKGIHWQDIAPANGREFTADDIVYHYNRLFGLGGGFTTPQPTHATDPEVGTLISVTATDKYTVVLKWKMTNPEFINETVQVSNSKNVIENPEAVKLWGNVNDWHHAIGTGPFILQDFVSGSSATLVKNPNYWGYDERYPQNKLPYVDSIKFLIIPDVATTLAAFRTNKIDYIDGLSSQQAQQVQKTNTKALQIPVPTICADTIDPRDDVAPFNDIRVRKAMQMAIDLPTIAKTYYNGSCPSDPSTLTSNYMTGWGFPYNQWPQNLKDEYAYNPTAAKKLLADAGYPNGFKTNIVVTTAADLDLLQIVKSYFTGVGIDMEIRTMDPASWTNFVQNAHKQDQLAERASGSGSLGYTFEPTRQFDRYRTGVASNYLMVSDPIFDASYTKFIAATKIDDIKQAVKDANEYLARQHFSISLLQPNSYTMCQPWLKGYNGQSNGIVGSTATGPLVLFFYGSRYWIDQNVKNSMGY